MKTSESIKTRFATKFLQAMKKLNKKRASTTNKYKRYRAVRAAARASMASAVGPKRAWSRALLNKVVNKTKPRGFITKRKKRVRVETLGLGEEEEHLRCLVPGGKGMEICSLLSETAHYIKCLKAQVQVMTTILDHYSTSSN